tara:strand:- start:760 stop:969 length:210 start_codon:yes stop_codon:yes gene_type:complete
MSKKLKCPLCGEPLMFKRVEDGFTLYEVKEDSIEEIASNSNGWKRVYCSMDEDHEISEDIIEKVLEMEK